MRRGITFGISALVLVFLFFFVYPQAWNKIADQIGLPQFFNTPFRLGLDLIGGTHLVYEADLPGAEGQSQQNSISELGRSMEGIRDVIERRVNLFGVQEPVVQVIGRNRLNVELAGVKDIQEAIKLIGETPFLEFRRPSAERPDADVALPSGNKSRESVSTSDNIGTGTLEPNFISTGLSGRHLKSAQLAFDPNTGVPQVNLEFNDEGAKLFSEITQRNLNKILAIFLDGQPISIPVVRDVITDGRAVISGQFTIQEAKELAQRLKAGALPVPIKLISQQSIGASLGKESLEKSLKAGLIGLILVAIFMIIFYRLPGLISILSLLIYVVLVLTIYKILPVTLSLAGLAGFILSLGMAVDANILIFSRIREEIKNGRGLISALDAGFHRAWSAIRDSQITTLISAIILYIFSTSLVKGFALTLSIGTLMSIFTAITVTKFLMKLILRESMLKWKSLF